MTKKPFPFSVCEQCCGSGDVSPEQIEEAVKECGFESYTWVQAAGVITTHGGPAAFGLAGFSK